MKALVTGGAGFAGRYLVSLLVQKRYQVCAADIHRQPDTSGGADVLEKELDVCQQTAMDDLLGEFVPDEVYHLAGIASPIGLDRQSYYRVNFLGTLNLFEAARKYAPQARILYVSSSNVYGVVPSDQQPICEDRLFAPHNHYAASKAAGEAAACAYGMEGLQIVRTRPFNHTGPGQSTEFVCSRLAKLVAEIAGGLIPPVIDAGNLDVERDFSDVRDVVRAYWLLLQQGQAGEAYNICSGQAVSIRTVACLLAELAQVKIEIRSQPELQRKVDLPLHVGSSEKIRGDTGWEPQISLRQTLKALLAYLQERVEKQLV
jgi:GDP-4-dehydro-6-deoxy-D-mannose reductase